MGGEPWCFPPDVIGRMTDRQIWEQYVRPHVTRYRRSRRGRGNRKAKPTPSRLPTREEFIAMGIETFALPREHLEREYDQWAASEEGVAALAAQESKGD